MAVKRRMVTKEYLNNTINQIQFNQNLMLQRASARYQLLLSVLVTLFAFFLGLSLDGMNYACMITIIIGIVVVLVYIAYEMEFANREADIGLSFRSVAEMKEAIDETRRNRVNKNKVTDKDAG